MTSPVICSQTVTCVPFGLNNAGAFVHAVDLDCPTLLTSEGPTTYEAPEEDWEHLPRPAYGMMPPRPWEVSGTKKTCIPHAPTSSPAPPSTLRN